MALNSDVQSYLEECFGYSRVEDIDELTLDCIRENAEEGYPYDAAIMWEHHRVTEGE